MQLQTISALEIFEQGLTKRDIKNMADRAVESVLDNGNVLQVAEAIAAMEAFIKEVKAKPEFKSYVREETAKHGKCFTAPSGAKIELAETGTEYDYSKCNDTELPLLEFTVMVAEDKVKQRKDFLKTVPTEGMEIRHEDQLIRVYPPSKKSNSSYKITIAL